MNDKMTRRTAARGRARYLMLGCIAAASGWSLLPADALADFAFTYRYELRPLELDPTRIAVLAAAPGESAAALEAALQVLAIEPGTLAPHGIPGYWLVEIASDQRTEASVRSIVRDAPLDARIAFASPVFVDDLGGPLIVTPRVVVGFTEGVSDQEIDRVLDAAGIGTLERVNGFGMRYIQSHRVNGIQVLEDANALARDPAVEFAEPDMIFTGRGVYTPDDPDFDRSWGLHNTGQFGGTPELDMDAADAWDHEQGDPSILVAVIDVGVEPFHPDIFQLAGLDFTNQDGDGGPVNECDNHGTPVAGCISSRLDNRLGTAGVAPGTRSVSLRTFISQLSCNGSWSTAATWTVDALEWARRAYVTNNSNFYGFQLAAIDEAYQSTRDGGTLHFASAGNFADPRVTYPASLPSVNAISAVEPDGSLAWFSNYGPDVAYSAPGTVVFTTDRIGNDGWSPDDYVIADGTSFASPYAAGVAALLFAADSELDPDGADALLSQGAVDLGPDGRDDEFGDGLVNAYRSVLLAVGLPPFHLNFTIEPASFACQGLDDATLTCNGLWSSALDGPMHVWVVASQPGGFLAGIGSLDFGVVYDPGVQVTGWTLCNGGTENPEDNGVLAWPAAGTGNSVRWPGDPVACYEPENDAARVGFFRVEQGSVGSISLTPDPRTAFLTARSCAELDTAVLPSQTGQAFFPNGTVPNCGEVPLAVPTVSVAGARATLRVSPNPFNPASRLHYELPSAGPVRLSVYDARGALVVALVDAVQPAGPHEVSWDGRDARGAIVGSGVFFARLEHEGGKTTRKLSVLK